MGHGPRGLLRIWRGLGLLPARSRPIARLPLGRGRPARHLRREAAALLRPGALERRRPDPEGAPVRADRQRGQPRRGRQGVLLLPRRDAHPLVPAGALQVSAAGVPLRRSGRGEPPARPGAAGVRADRHRRLRRGSLLRRRGRVRQGRAERHPDPDLGHQPRSGPGAAAPAANALVPQHLVLGPRRPAARASRRATERHRSERDEGRGGRLVQAMHHEPRGVLAGLPGQAGAAVHRERDERAAALGRAEPDAVRQGWDQRAVVDGRDGAVNPDGVGTKVAAHYALEIAPGATETVLLRLSTERHAIARSPTPSRSSPTGSPRPTRFYAAARAAGG